MKKLFLSLVAVATFSFVNAQVTTPQASPRAKTEADVGLTTVAVDYSRPSVKGRTVFGDLVAYGKKWRTGANLNSIFETSDDITIAGSTLKAGKYAIYTVPNQSAWEVMFYTETTNGGVPSNWDDSKVALKTSVTPQKTADKIETFTIGIDNVTINSADLTIGWENTLVAIPFEVPTDVKTMASITATMKGKPTAQDYLAAGSYYYTTSKDAHQAMVWYDQGVKMLKQPAFYHLRQQSLIHAQAGDIKGAIKIAKESLKASEKVGSEDYIKMNKASIEEWSKK